MQESEDNNINAELKILSRFVLDEANFAGENLDEDLADFSAIKSGVITEQGQGLNIMLGTLSFLIVLHVVGYLLVPKYGSFMPMHLLSLSLGCFTFALLTALHVYAARVRNIG